ncbi:MAG: hypothetical protein GY810_18980 [Aureispira sp.]|nr:hypothetical protein [Aureispira sp.]
MSNLTPFRSKIAEDLEKMIQDNSKEPIEALDWVGSALLDPNTGEKQWNVFMDNQGKYIVGSLPLIGVLFIMGGWPIALFVLVGTILMSVFRLIALQIVTGVSADNLYQYNPYALGTKVKKYELKALQNSAVEGGTKIRYNLKIRTLKGKYLNVANITKEEASALKKFLKANKKKS